MAEYHTTFSHNQVMTKEKEIIEKNEVYARMEEVLGDRGYNVTQTAVGEFFSVDQTAARKWITRGPPFWRIEYFCAYFEICPNWLIAGIEPKYPPDPGVQKLIQIVQKHPDTVEALLGFAGYTLSQKGKQ